jgi:hypothetical protein
MNVHIFDGECQAVANLNLGTCDNGECINFGNKNMTDFLLRSNAMMYGRTSSELIRILSAKVKKLPTDDREKFNVAMEEQFSDMQGGMCPSGQIHRLLQLVYALEDI